MICHHCGEDLILRGNRNITIIMECPNLHATVHYENCNITEYHLTINDNENIYYLDAYNFGKTKYTLIYYKTPSKIEKIYQEKIFEKIDTKNDIIQISNIFKKVIKFKFLI